MSMPEKLFLPIYQSNTSEQKLVGYDQNSESGVEQWAQLTLQ